MPRHGAGVVLSVDCDRAEKSMRATEATTAISAPSPTAIGADGLDRPWRRPGARRYALSRFKGAVRPPVSVYEPEPGTVVCDWDVAVTVRDATVLRVNVFRPPGDAAVPVILSAHPYGKDRLPSKKGRRSKFP